MFVFSHTGSLYQSDEQHRNKEQIKEIKFLVNINTAVLLTRGLCAKQIYIKKNVSSNIVTMKRP